MGVMALHYQRGDILQVYLACWDTSCFLTSLRSEAPYLGDSQHQIHLLADNQVPKVEWKLRRGVGSYGVLAAGRVASLKEFKLLFIESSSGFQSR